jgi:hypothetical protein
MILKEKGSHNKDGEVRVFERIGFGDGRFRHTELRRSTFFGVERSVVEIH